jgi:hypothetical protein
VEQKVTLTMDRLDPLPPKSNGHNMFSSEDVQSNKVFSQSSNCCLHCHNTMSPFKPPTNFTYNLFFFISMFVFNFMPLVVDHVTRVVVTSGYDQPIICISLGKSTNTTFSASTFGTFGDYSLKVNWC